MSAPPPMAIGPSVLPSVRAESRPGGIALVRPAGGDLPVVFPLVGGIFALVGGGMTIGGILAGSMVGFMGVFFLLVGLVFLGVLGWRLYQRATLGDAELLFSTMPLRLGVPMEVRFSQRRHSSRALVEGITARIECDEWVRYRQGTDTRTDTWTLWSQELPQGVQDPLGAAEVLTGIFHLRLPPELPPSFSASDNALRWRIVVDVAIQGRPDLRNTFLLPVLPEVARDLR